MKTYEAKNIMCENCANTIKVSLEDDFGDVKVDVANKYVSLNVDETNEEAFKAEMAELGFEVVKEVK